MAAPIQSLPSETCSMLRRLCVLIAQLTVAVLVAAGAHAQPAPDPRTAVVLSLDGIVGPATADFLIRGLAAAREQDAVVVVFNASILPAGHASMRDIIHAILASPCPPIARVAPNGSRAASAGTYILYASHVAAMAPATNLGAATPISLGGSPPRPAEPASGKKPAPGVKAKIAPPSPPEDAGGSRAISDAPRGLHRSARCAAGRDATQQNRRRRRRASLSSRRSAASQ